MEIVIHVVKFIYRAALWASDHNLQEAMGKYVRQGLQINEMLDFLTGEWRLSTIYMEPTIYAQ